MIGGARITVSSLCMGGRVKALADNHNRTHAVFAKGTSMTYCLI
jgi:hypothetical protein